jgi:hypothetical protein
MTSPKAMPASSSEQIGAHGIIIRDYFAAAARSGLPSFVGHRCASSYLVAIARIRLSTQPVERSLIERDRSCLLFSQVFTRA